MDKVRTIDLPKIVDPRGNLTVAEEMKNVPFDIARVYWTYDVPSGERRGGHAHRTCEEVVVAVSGSFDVEVFDGYEHQTFHLNHPYQGLYNISFRVGNLTSGISLWLSQRTALSSWIAAIWIIIRKGLPTVR